MFRRFLILFINFRYSICSRLAKTLVKEMLYKDRSTLKCKIRIYLADKGYWVDKKSVDDILDIVKKHILP